MTVVNPKSISGINSITTGSGSDNLLTIHTSDANNTERLRIDSTGATKIVTGIVTTLTATTGIVTTLTANTVTSLGAVSGTTGTFTGNVAVSGANITLQDSGGATDDRIVLGAGSDLSIYHDGSHSIIQETGTGDLELCSNTRIMLQKDRTEALAKFIPDGAVELYYDNTKRFATTGNGADVFGNGTSNNKFKLINTSGTSNASHHMTLDTFNASGYWSDLKIDASNIQLNTYTGNRATLSNNALTFATGVNIAMANGNGINFAATSDASGMQNELLDDYEEGVWTPLVRNSSGTGTAGAANYGYYTKIGNVVHAHATVHWTALNSGTTSSSALIVGLPFSTKNATGYRCQHLTGAQIVGVQAGSTNNISIAVDGNMSTAYIINVNNAAGASSNYIHTPTINSSGTIYGLSITYLT